VSVRLPILALPLLLVIGCAVTPAGLRREQSLYAAGTNLVMVVQRDVSPYVPPPYSQMLEGFLAAATAGLAAWNLNQQRRISQLRNGLPQAGSNTVASRNTA